MAGNLTAMIAAAFSGGAAPPVTTDPYFEYTTLLLPGNGTNGAQNNTFLDSSTNNFTITRNPATGPNAPTQGTFSPFSQTGWGNYFGGTDGFLTTATNSAFTFGTGDFTVELWCYPISSTGAGGYAYLYAQGPNTTSALGIYFQSNTFRVWNGSTVITGTVSRSTNTWYHVALSRSGTSMKLFVNGVQDGSTATNSSNITTGSTYGATLGRWVEISDPNYFVGYLSSVRAVKGTAVYTSDFTPPTSPLTAISGTSLLTCQSNRFIDNSTNNFTITRNGNTSVVAFSPFNPSASWSAATYGGSGYFDGSGDYLTVPNNTAIQLGTGDFEVDAWVYVSSLSQFNVIDFRSTASATPATFYFTSTGLPSLYDGSSAFSGSSGITVNQWNYVVWTRASGTLRMFVNGTSVYSASNSSNLTGAGTNATIGANASASDLLNGYLGTIRIVKGAGITTSTVPTAPLTAISGTGLLLNFTNAGIYDATSKNDLETVGNAQISTAINNPFGLATGSMYFDGTGDYLLSQASNDLYAFGSGDFTIELWLRLNNVSGQKNIYDPNPTSTVGLYPNIYILNTTLYYFTNGSNRITAGTALSADTWYHIAVARSGTSTKMFLNGTQEGSTYTDSNVYINGGAGRPVIGGSGYTLGSNILNGYIQDLRITKGYARYTANFTPPTAAFPTL